MIGIDIEPYVIDRANQRVVALGEAERVRFVGVEPGPLPFADASFDLVFSKDAIIHVQDKQALYAEAHRVLRPGGWLCVGDWLRGEGADLDADVEAFSGQEFFMQSLAELGELVSSTGFVEIELGGTSQPSFRLAGGRGGTCYGRSACSRASTRRVAPLSPSRSSARSRSPCRV